MTTISPRRLQSIAWGLSGAVTVLAIVAWGQRFNWQFDRLNAYGWFPLFGLLAFSLMWTHYIMGALRRYSGQDKTVLKKYFRVTSFVVLLALILHPAILAWQLWRAGLGLPPGSYRQYIGPALYGAILLGAAAWLAFMAFEFHRWWGKRPWWRFVQYASDVAMVAVFLHGLRLGGELQSGWFVGVWWFYGLTLLLAIIYGYQARRQTRGLVK